LNRKRDTAARIPKVTKPDIDNLIKMVLDVLTKAEVWVDDNQVVQVVAEDWYCSKAEEPHTQWRIYTMQEDN
jgi:Holliday junction resolvase RusA-like endonuclease